MNFACFSVTGSYFFLVFLIFFVFFFNEHLPTTTNVYGSSFSCAKLAIELKGLPGVMYGAKVTVNWLTFFPNLV